MLSKNTVKSYISCMKSYSTNEELIELDNFFSNRRYNRTLLLALANRIQTMDIKDSYIKQIYSVIRKLKAEVQDQFKNRFEAYSSEADERHRTYKIDKNKLNIISFNETNVYECINKLVSNRDKLIYGLLTLFPTRRMHDYRYMKYVKSLEKDKSFNYFVKDENKFYFFNTKNKKQSSFTVESKLLLKLIFDMNLTYGKWLLEIFYEESNLSTKVSNITKFLHNTDLNASDIRRIFTSTLKDKDRKMMGYMMGHSELENIFYSRTCLD